jgi:Protein of unknown function (DUF2388).
MKTLSLILTFAFALSTHAGANAGETAKQTVFATTMAPLVITMSPFLPTFLTFSADKTWKKEVIAAKEDLNYFLVTEGQERTVRAEFALGLLRQEAELSEFTDLELAQLGLALGE